MIDRREPVDAHLVLLCADGRRAGSVTKDNGYTRISVIDLRTNRVTRLRLGRGPTWSPDGKRIAFSRARDIYEMNADGSKLATVTR